MKTVFSLFFLAKICELGNNFNDDDIVDNYIAAILELETKSKKKQL